MAAAYCGPCRRGGRMAPAVRTFGGVAVCEKCEVETNTEKEKPMPTGRDYLLFLLG